MQTLYKKDARQFISIFVKKLDIADYKDVKSNFEKFLNQNKMEVIVTDNVKSLPIDAKSRFVWANALEQTSVRNTGINRRNDIIHSNYDIGTTVQWLEQFYELHVHREGNK